jgi:hypothetical protein
MQQEHIAIPCLDTTPSYRNLNNLGSLQATTKILLPRQVLSSKVASYNAAPAGWQTCADYISPLVLKSVSLFEIVQAFWQSFLCLQTFARGDSC